MMDWSKRSTQSEIMDDFQGELNVLREVFADIDLANRLLGGHINNIRAITDLIAEHPQNEYVIADMGCGDGAILRALADYCKKKDTNVTFVGIDLSEDVLLLAKEASRGYEGIQYLQADILQLSPVDFKCDIIISTLTMHHFTDNQIPLYLKKLAELARIGVIINDLHRSPLAYYLFKAVSRIFIKTKVAKNDGAISVKRAFVRSDLVGYLEHLPDMNHSIRWKWAFRFVWVMQPNRLR